MKVRINALFPRTTLHFYFFLVKENDVLLNPPDKLLVLLPFPRPAYEVLVMVDFDLGIVRTDVRGTPLSFRELLIPFKGIVSVVVEFVWMNCTGFLFVGELNFFQILFG